MSRDNDEIGERLRDVLARHASEIPPRLPMSIDKLAELERAPLIVPSIELHIFSAYELLSAFERIATLGQKLSIVRCRLRR
jgi:hypothetical protein